MTSDGALQDRLAIRERIEAYSDAVFRQDADAWIACWRDDAVWSLLGMELIGAPAIKAAWIQAMSAFKLAAFFATPGAIDIQGRTATAQVWTQEVLIGTDGAVRRIIGAYADELVKENGAWLFQRRVYQVLHDQTEA